MHDSLCGRVIALPTMIVDNNTHVRTEDCKLLVRLQGGGGRTGSKCHVTN